MDTARQTLTPHLKGLAQLYMLMDDYTTAGALHIWFADENCQRSHVAYCAGACYPRDTWYNEPGRKNPEMARLAYYLARIGVLYLTTTQRVKLQDLAWDKDHLVPAPASPSSTVG